MGKIRTQKRLYVDNLNKFGIFSAFLLVTVFSVWFYSPVISSHADDSAIVNVNIDIQPTISLTLNADELDFHISPKSSEAVSQEKTVTATVHTNNAYGYQLYFSSVDDATDMTSEISNDVIESITSQNSNLEVPSGKDGTWGYSKTGNSGSWNPIPTSSSQDLVKSVFYAVVNKDSVTTLHVGVAAKSSLDAGTYSKDVKFSAVIGGYIDNTSFSNITQMQQMTPSICENAEVGASVTLQDVRDDSTYVIRKLADNQCWMMQDLRLTGPITLTSADSDVTTNFTLPAPMEAGSSWYEPVDEAVSKPLSNATSTEGLGYNYYAASAGTITSSDMEVVANHSICPSGWTLPSQTQINNFLSANEITNNEQGYNMLTSSPFNITVVNGYSYYRYDSSSFFNSAYWSSGAGFVSSGDSPTRYRRVLWAYHNNYNDNNTYSVYYTIHDSLDPANIRCIAR